MDDRQRLAGQIRTAVSVAVNLLVKGEYDTLEAMTRGRLLSAALLRQAVEGYGRRLTPPPDSAWEDLDVVQAPDVKPATFHVVFPLWNEEEGMSDLSVELRLIEAYPSAFETEVTAIHVL